MVENLKETVKNILEDEKKVKEFGELKTLEEVYEKCKELGYTSNYEEFKKDYNQIVYGLNQEISSEELESVTGGKMNKKLTKTMAVALSALTLSTAVVPSSNAAGHNASVLKSSTSKVVNFIKENPGKSLLIALGATAAVGSGVLVIGGIKHFFGKNEQSNSSYIEVYSSKITDEKIKERDQRIVNAINYLNNRLCDSECDFLHPKNAEEVAKSLKDTFYKAQRISGFIMYYSNFFDFLIKYIYKIHYLYNVKLEIIVDGLDLFIDKMDYGINSKLTIITSVLCEVVEYIKDNNLSSEERKELFNDVFGPGSKIFKNPCTEDDIFNNNFYEDFWHINANDISGNNFYKTEFYKRMEELTSKN